MFVQSEACTLQCFAISIGLVDGQLIGEYDYLIGGGITGAIVVGVIGELQVCGVGVAGCTDDSIFIQGCAVSDYKDRILGCT